MKFHSLLKRKTLTMSNEDTAQDATVETVEAPEGVEAPQEVDQVQDEANDTDAPVEAEEPKEETVEEKLARLESLEKKAQDAKKKQNAQRKHIASLQKVADERARQLEELQSQQQNTETLEPKRPDKADYVSLDDYEQAYEKYVEDLSDFKAKSKYQAEREKQLQAEMQQTQIKAQQERSNQYEAQKKSFMEVVPDYVDSEAEFNDYIQQAQGVADPRVQDAIVTQAYRGDGVTVPQLVHYFGGNGGENIGELEEISKLSPNEAAVEIYKIQEKIKSNPTKREKSKPLPKPPQKARGGKNIPKDLSDGDILKNLGLK